MFLQFLNSYIRFYDPIAISTMATSFKRLALLLLWTPIKVEFEITQIIEEFRLKNVVE